MPNNRPNPDDLLASIKKDEAKKKRGKLKIFLGMCPGVGKTYAMLEAARQREAEGVDVLIGVAETHGRKETEKLLEGLAVAAKVERPYRGTILKEMDLDTVLAIRPQLLIVDELAHTNAPGSRHPKRYQDVLELLDAGVDVFTTLNVQHIESRSDAVRQITGIAMRETVPDSILDQADEVTLIDLPPEQLRDRLKKGKVYIGEQAATAADNFFREENLIALREMALRITAEHVSQDLREAMSEQRISGPWKSSERLMVAVGPTPFSESLIRWTRSTAASLSAPWVAAYIETPKVLTDEEKNKLAKNLTLARQLGAEVIVRSGIDIAETLLEVASQTNVTQICVGKPSEGLFWQWLRGGSFVQSLIEKSGNIDIHMVRVKSLGTPEKKLKLQQSRAFDSREYGIAFGLVAATTILGLFLEKFIGYSSVALIYLLVVVISGVYLGRGPVLALAALSATLWNFLFIPPKFTFLISNGYDVMMFLMYFVIAILMGQTTSRLREREQAERKQEDRIRTLYQLSHVIVATHDSHEATKTAIQKLESIFRIKAALFLIDDEGRPNFGQSSAGSLLLSQKEKSVANWTFQKQQAAGRFTDTLPESQNFFLPLTSMGKTLGVLAIDPLQNQAWSLDQRDLLESFSALLTVMLEKDEVVRAAQSIQVKLASERLQSALLDSVSHELKTPLAVIHGLIEHLNKEQLSSAEFRKLTNEISIASDRLLKTVNGLLDMSRLDAGRLEPNLDWHDMHDVINASVETVQKEMNQHQVKIIFGENLPLVKIDAVMIQQVVTNLLSNSATYAPLHTEITVTTQIDQNELVVRVSDRGPGISEEELEKIFEKFYRGKKASTGGLGLGLSIAKRFVEAHGGQISAQNQESGGACLTFRIPVELFKSSLEERKS